MLLFVALSVYYLAVYLSFLLIGIVGALFLVITLSGASDSDSCSLCWDQGHNSSYSKGHLMLPGFALQFRRFLGTTPVKFAGSGQDLRRELIQTCFF